MKRIIAAVAALLFCLAGTTVSAQSGYQVKGVVVDATGPVIGATVMEQGTSNGTSTGFDGDYVLNVSSPDAIVVISCIGYTAQSFKASAVPAVVTIVEDSEFLDDVVVIGYGTVKKNDMTGSITAIPSCREIAPNSHTDTHSPYPRHPNLQALGPLFGAFTAMLHTSGPT